MDVWTRAELISQGWTSRALTTAVRSGQLIRARRDRYLPADAPGDLVEAVRVGGLLSCLSFLRLLEVFVLSRPALHVHMTRGSSRMRSPKTRAKRLAPRAKRKPVLHWHSLVDESTRSCVGIVDALIHAVRCQPPRQAIATIDSALNKGLLRLEQLADVFAALPARYGVLRAFIDGRAQAGPETLVRLMVRSLGCSVDLQVEFAEVGFVDLVVDGWLVIECDSKTYHSSWKQQLKDYRRDLRLAQYGFCVVRLTAEDILYEPDTVMASLRGVLRARR